ncbi:hypothetical protein NDU88_004873 [Pleurodeles waltl]|uniref:Speriolin C-terminal domain-containing protein n=1 Tax=Pleurodeles waltl TaxID=8319 RepID=A0AAV7V4Q5_PLEWA|nr:hypothetical protein NDU88_004873 [Pleurodeles waltl]
MELLQSHEVEALRNENVRLLTENGELRKMVGLMQENLELRCTLRDHESRVRTLSPPGKEHKDKEAHCGKDGKKDPSHASHAPPCRDPKQLQRCQRVVGEIAFQLDRRILSSIFLEQSRLYGFTVSNVQEKIIQVVSPQGFLWRQVCVVAVFYLGRKDSPYTAHCEPLALELSSFRGAGGASLQGCLVCSRSGRPRGGSLLECLGAWVLAPLSPSRPAAHCSPHLGARGGPTAGGAPIAAPSPPGWIRRRSALQAARTPQLPQPALPDRRAAQPGTPGAPLTAQGRAVPQSTGTRTPGPSAGSPSPPPHPRSKQLRQGAGSSESVCPGGSGSDGHFLAPAASRERGSASPPLTTLGPQRDGEITGMVGTAPLGR